MRLYVGRDSKFQIMEFGESLKPEIQTIQFGDQKNWGFISYGNHLYTPQVNKLACFTRNLIPVPKQDIPIPEGVDLFYRSHQLLIDGDLVYVTNTGKNSVYIFCLASHRLKEIRSDTTRSWPNCLNKIDGNLWLLYNNCRDKAPSDLVTLNDIHVLPDVGHMAHNVWKMHGKLWVSDTKHGLLRSIDGSMTVAVGGFLRGLALSEKYLFVGVSKNRQPDGEHRVTPEGQAGIAIFDAATLEYKTFWPLESTNLFDGVFEIRLLGEQDLATSNPPLHLEV